jgi:hypothetical protein
MESKRKMIPVKIWASGIISKSFIKYPNNDLESMTSQNCRKEAYWPLLTYFGNRYCKSTKHLS